MSITRRMTWFSASCAAALIVSVQPSWAQNAPRVARRMPTPQEFQNRLPTKLVEVAPNDIIEPIPLTAKRLESTREAVSDTISDQVTQLKAKTKTSFPDELDALSETGKWTPEQRNNLSKALKLGDPAAVYKSWLEAEPENMVGAERISRQTAVLQAFNQLEQHAQDGKVEPQHVVDLQDALAKLATTQPANEDLKENLETLLIWSEMRRILEGAVAEPAAVAKLPAGDVRLILNPNLDPGTAIVFSDETVMVGNRGRGGVKITKGNAAEALGLPVIAATPVADSEGSAINSGTLLMNPKKSGATVRYLINGNAYEMEPGMSQWLPGNQHWLIDFDRGGKLGASRYTLSDGTFRFAPTDVGWELYQERYDITLDNSRDPKDFHAVIDDQRFVVRSGHTKMISSLYPITLRYDRGHSSTAAAKKLNFSGTVEVAINAADNLWDVFPEQGNKKPIDDVEIFNK